MTLMPSEKIRSGNKFYPLRGLMPGSNAQLVDLAFLGRSSKFALEPRAAAFLDFAFDSRVLRRGLTALSDSGPA